MKKISADWIFPVHAAPIKNGVVIINDSGEVLKIDVRSNYKEEELDIHSGILIPGFINTHCHLELSHMKGRVATGTTLIPFITSVVQNREAAETIIQQAIEQADREMYEGGIVAVGDISNQPDTFAPKGKSKLTYYTFVEMFDFLQDGDAQKNYDQYKAVYDQLEPADGHQKSCVPHATYSVSETLFDLINKTNQEKQQTISIHNQETLPENELFLNGTGGFVDFYGKFGISMEQFEAPRQTAIHYALAHLDPQHRTLFVHNTLSTREDIQAAQDWSKEVYWATCPNANLYIENRLPNYQAFLDTNACMTIGTDSLTSNWQLSVLEEMKTITRYQSYISFEMVLEWATLNGAKALGFEDNLGSLEVGKSPGLNLLDMIPDEKGNFSLQADTRVKRLV